MLVVWLTQQPNETESGVLTAALLALLRLDLLQLYGTFQVHQAPSCCSLLPAGGLLPLPDANSEQRLYATRSLLRVAHSLAERR